MVSMDTPAVTLGYRAWCQERLRSDPVDDHGVIYQATCYALREAILTEYGPPDAPQDVTRWGTGRLDRPVTTFARIHQT
jgi:hypothetical protein